MASIRQKDTEQNYLSEALFIDWDFDFVSMIEDCRGVPILFSRNTR